MSGPIGEKEMWKTFSILAQAAQSVKLDELFVELIEVASIAR